MEITKELMLTVFNKLKDSYYKSLFVNFTTDEYTALTIPTDEDFLNEHKSCKISEYFKWFSESDLIHKDDVNIFNEFAKNPLKRREVIYRRKIEGVYKTVVMMIVDMPYYKEESQECFLYVKDINELFKSEYERVAERIARNDDMTNTLNKYAFKIDIAKEYPGYVGVIYCDINALKYVNDKNGHEAGDLYIIRFVDMLKTSFGDFNIYRLGGDEFVAIASDIQVFPFIQRASAFQKSLWRDERYPIASIGFSADVASNLPQVISAAEKAMYEEKDIFARIYPDLKRK